jgi:hypothetical protein
MKVAYELDYDWKDADSCRAEATIELLGDGDAKGAEQALIQADDDIESEFGNRAVSFIPDKINDEECDPESDQFSWAVTACLDHLQKHPEVRKFNLSGIME